MLNPKNNVVKLNMTSLCPYLHIFKWPPKIMEFDILLKYFIFYNVFKTLVICPKMALH